MKRDRLLLALLVGVCLVFAIPSLVLSKPITLTMACQDGETNWGPSHALIPWAKKIEEVTKGQVKVQIYFSQTLVKGKDTWTAIKSGIADMGWGFHGYWAGMTPLADVISLPALPFTKAEKGSEVLWKLYEKFPQIQKQFADNQILLFFTTDPYDLITRKKQVKTIQDIKGMKIRMTGGPPTDQMKALGGVPVMIPMPDNYISLQKGVIDGMGAPWEAIRSFRLYEVVKYYTAVPFPATYHSVSMNKNKWNSLSKDIQDAIMSVSGLEGSKFWGRNFFDAAKEDAIQAAEKAGFPINVYTLPDEERARWVEISGKPLWDAWVRKMESKGFSNAREILDSTLELSKQ